MHYQLSFYVPSSHLESVKSALFASGAGAYERYDQCCWQVLGEGQFRPTDGANPFDGKIGQVSCEPEYRVEMLCTQAVISNAVAALKEAHPYEEVAYSVFKCVDIK